MDRLEQSKQPHSDICSFLPARSALLRLRQNSWKTEIFFQVPGKERFVLFSFVLFCWWWLWLWLWWWCIFLFCFCFIFLFSCLFVLFLFFMYSCACNDMLSEYGFRVYSRAKFSVAELTAFLSFFCYQSLSD